MHIQQVASRSGCQKRSGLVRRTGESAGTRWSSSEHRQALRVTDSQGLLDPGVPAREGRKKKAIRRNRPNKKRPAREEEKSEKGGSVAPTEAKTGCAVRKGMNFKQCSGCATEERLEDGRTANSRTASSLRETSAVYGPLHNIPFIYLFLCLKIQKHDPVNPRENQILVPPKTMMRLTMVLFVNGSCD